MVIGDPQVENYYSTQRWEAKAGESTRSFGPVQQQKSPPFPDRMERQGLTPEGCFLTSTGVVWMHALYMPFP